MRYHFPTVNDDADNNERISEKVMVIQLQPKQKYAEQESVKVRSEERDVEDGGGREFERERDDGIHEEETDVEAEDVEEDQRGGGD